MEPQKFELEETPYLSELESVLRGAGKRPLSKLNKQRHFLVSFLQHILFPSLGTPSKFVFTFVQNVAKWVVGAFFFLGGGGI